MNDELNSILEKVQVLYHKYGIKSITMDDVSRELGISKKTLYQYVVDKTDLVNKVLELEVSNRNLEFNLCTGSEKNAIEEMVDVHWYLNKMMKDYNPSTDYDLKKYYPDLYRKYHESRRKKMYEKVLSNIRKGKKQGLYRMELNEEIIAKLTILRAESIIDNEIYNTSEFTSKRYFMELIIFHIRGIANQEGIKVLEKNIKKFELLNDDLIS